MRTSEPTALLMARLFSQHPTRSMMTCYPQLLHNFIYKSPALGGLLRDPMGVVDCARYLCSRDLTISAAFCRKFRWDELMLWPQVGGGARALQH